MLDISRSKLVGSESTTIVVEAGQEMHDPYGWSEPQKSEDIVVVIGNEVERKMRWRQYLDDFEKYLRAKAEYERLEGAAQGGPMGGAGGGAPAPTLGSAAEGPGSSAVTEPEEPAAQERHEILQKLKESTDRLKKEKSTGAVRAVLVDVSHAQMAGVDGDPLVAGAMQTAAGVLNEIVKKATDELRDKRSARAVKKLLTALAQAQMVGPENEIADAAMKTVGNAVEEMANDAERRFRRQPSVANYREWVEKRVAAQMAGRRDTKNSLRGVKRLRPPGLYKVESGDSLSKIAEKFYGHTNLWDVIYEKNARKIGDDPNLILPEIFLDIP